MLQLLGIAGCAGYLSWHCGAGIPELVERQGGANGAQNEGGTGASLSPATLRTPTSEIHHCNPRSCEGTWVPSWAPTSQHKAGRWQQCPGDPLAPPALARLSPACTQVQGDVNPCSWGDPGIRTLRWGVPQDGHPGHLPGCACAPAACLCSLTSQLPSAVRGKADYVAALQLSPSLRRLLPPRSSAWHGPGAGGSGGSLWRGARAIPMVEANLRSGDHSGSATPEAIPFRGMSAPQNPRGRKSLSPLPKFHPLPTSPITVGSGGAPGPARTLAAPALSIPPRAPLWVSLGAQGHPAFLLSMVGC